MMVDSKKAISILDVVGDVSLGAMAPKTGIFVIIFLSTYLPRVYL